MSQTLPIVIVSSLLAGGAGAVAATALTSSAPAPAETTTPQLGDEILAQLEGLQEIARENAKRIEELETAPTLAPVGSMRADADGGLSEADVRAIVSELTAKEVGEPSSMAAATVERVLEQREERERLEREQRRAQEREKRVEDRLAKMQTELGLDLGQMNQMRSLYLERDAKRDEMRQTMRQGFQDGTVTRESMGEMWRTMQTEHETAVQGILTAGQYEQYQESGYDDPWGGRGRRGNDGGGGNARGGNTNRGGGGGGRRGGF